MGLTLTYVERQDILLTYQKYPDAEICRKAVANYSRVLREKNKYDPGGCVYRSFEGFLRSGIPKFQDAAKPFERFKRAIKAGERDGGYWEQIQKELEEEEHEGKTGTD
jgi:hypothetical protein